MAAGGTHTESLDALVEQARVGSHEAFTALWQQLAPVVAGYVRGRGVRDPDDVTSEVFLAVFQKLPQFVGTGAQFRRWLFTIAHHRAVDAIRRQVRSQIEDPYASDTDPRRSGSAEDNALTRLATQEALALLGRLPEDQRNVLLLRVVADLPAIDVAAVLDRSPEAVRQLQHRALQRLRRDLPPAAGALPVTPPGPPTIAQT